MNGIHENYKTFWKELYGEKVEFKEIEEAYKRLYGEDLWDCLDRELACKTMSGYMINYEKYAASMKELVENGDAAISPNSQLLYIPYILELKRRLVKKGFFNDGKKISLFIADSSAISLCNQLVPVSMKVLMQELRRLCKEDRLGTNDPEKQFEVFQNKMIYENSGRGDARLVYDYQKFETGENRVSDVLTEADKNDIRRGFMYGYEVILRNKQEYGRTIVELFSDVEIRVLLKNTANYSTMLNVLYNPDMLMDETSPKVLLCRDYISEGDPDDADVYKLENNALLRGDIPYFYAKVNGHDLFSDNVILREYFNIAPMTQVERKIKMMSKEDMSFQSAIIQKTFDDRKAIVEKDFSGLKYDIENYKCELAAELAGKIEEKSFHFGKDNYYGWMDTLMDETEDGGNGYSYIGNNLYNGDAGIAISLLYLAIVSKERKYIDFAEKIVSYENMVFCTYDNNNPYLIGAFDGIGSNLYINSKLYIFTGRKLYKDYMLKIIDFIDNIVEKDTKYDIISGTSGYLSVLCSIYESVSESDVKERVRKAMEHASEFLASNFNFLLGGWRIGIEKEKKVFTGFGHGDSGIMTALARCGYDLNEKKHCEIINRVLEVHRNNYFITGRGWYRDNRKNLIGYGWCHGTTGILLSRLLLKSYGIEHPYLDEDIEIAEDLSRKCSVGKSVNLCHGDLSTLEILGMIDDKHKKQSDTAFAWLIAKEFQQRKEGYCFRGMEVLGLMVGMAGYIYALAKSCNDDIPSVLYLA